MALPVRPAYKLYQWLWAGLDLIYPPVCGGCDKTGARWCMDCQQRTIQIHNPICEICGDVTAVHGVCLHCKQNNPPYKALRSFSRYEGPLKNAIQRLKYERDVGLGEVLARQVLNYLDNLDWHFDLVVPVPLGLARFMDRGYNQAALLARPIALARGVPYSTKALIRIKETRTQVGLNHAERFENVRSAFQADKNRIVGKRVLIIDDVSTSGATMRECADAVRSADSLDVYCMTLARA